MGTDIAELEEVAELGIFPGNILLSITSDKVIDVITACGLATFILSDDGNFFDVSDGATFTIAS